MNSNARRRVLRRGSAAGILAAAALFGAALVPGGRIQDATPQTGGTLRVRGLAESGRPDLDPASGRWVFVTEQIYEGLVWLDEKLQPSPRLAQYWTISKDGRTYVFYLRPGVKFHNGDALTSEDVKFSLERLLRRETNSPVRDYFLARIAGAPTPPRSRSNT